MEKLKRHEAFARATKAFGEWRTWSRWEHIAYGLIRGIPYPAMERCSNDAPYHYGITECLLKLGAWPEADLSDPKNKYSVVRTYGPEIVNLVVWVRKPVRMRKSREETLSEASP